MRWPIQRPVLQFDQEATSFATCWCSNLLLSLCCALEAATHPEWLQRTHRQPATLFWTNVLDNQASSNPELKWRVEILAARNFRLWGLGCCAHSPPMTSLSWALAHHYQTRQKEWIRWSIWSDHLLELTLIWTGAIGWRFRSIDIFNHLDFSVTSVWWQKSPSDSSKNLAKHWECRAWCASGASSECPTPFIEFIGRWKHLLHNA